MNFTRFNSQSTSIFPPHQVLGALSFLLSLLCWLVNADGKVFRTIRAYSNLGLFNFGAKLTLCVVKRTTPQSSASRLGPFSLQILQEKGPLQDLSVGFCLTLGNELSKEMHVLTKQETLLGRGAWAESSRGNPGGLLCLWLTVTRFMVMGFLSRLSLANHSNSRPFLAWPTHCSVKMDASMDTGRW